MKQSEAERLAMEEEEKGVSEKSDEEVPSEEIYEESYPKQDNPIPSLTRLSDDEEMEWNVDDADESSVEEFTKGDALGSATAQKELDDSNPSNSEKDSVKLDDGSKVKESNENTTTKESNSTEMTEPTPHIIQSTSAQSQSSELLEIGKDGKLVKSKPKLNLMDLFNKAKEKKAGTVSEKKDQKDEKDEQTNDNTDEQTNDNTDKQINDKIDLQNEPKSESSEDPLFEKEDEETVDENDYEEQQPTAEDYARYKAMMQESSIRSTPFDM